MLISFKNLNPKRNNKFLLQARITQNTIVQGSLLAFQSLLLRTKEFLDLFLLFPIMFILNKKGIKIY